MQLHQVNRIHPHKRKRTIGRGGKRGKTSGRGTKGQLARAGRKLRPELRDIIKKIPKKRGYRFQSKETRATVVTLTSLAKAFPEGGVVTRALLAERGLVGRGPRTVVKILGPGSITVALQVSGVEASGYVAEAIRAAGGTVEPSARP